MSNYEELSQKYGNKFMNLARMRDYLANLSYDDDSIKVDIPKFEGIESDVVINVIKSFYVDFEKDWGEFVDAIDGNDQLTLATETKLNKVRDGIVQALHRSDFTKLLTNILHDFGDVQRLMVRSTGKEDSLDMANQGGNESIPAENNVDDVAQAIQRVVLSYFSSKSIGQRLLGGDKITKDLFAPILLQEMVFEQAAAHDVTKENSVYSGVIYNMKTGNSIDYAPGFGEYVVNSKGPVNRADVTADKVQYQLVQQQPFRLRAEIAKDADSQNKLNVVAVSNSQELTENKLDSKVIARLDKLADDIKKLYNGQAMDIEFVYDPKQNVIKLLQARPIPEIVLEQNTIDLKLLADSNVEFIKLKGSNITPDVQSIRTFDSANKHELLIVNTIGEALNHLLNPANKDQVIRAVVIRDNAPTTSHEAGVFRSKNIPVIRIKDIAQVKAISDLKNDESIVIDPQRKTIFKLNGAVEQYVKEGLVRSGLTSHVTPEQGIFVGDSNIIASQGLVNLEDSVKFGELIERAKNGTEEDSAKLMSFMWKAMKLDRPIAMRKNGAKNRLISSDDFEVLDLDEKRESVRAMIQDIVSLRKKNKISHDVFVATMISGAELSLVLGNNNAEYTKDYLDVFEKFNGLIREVGDKQILSNSIGRELALRQKMRTVYKPILSDIKKRKLEFPAPENKVYYMNAMLMSKCFYEDKDKALWQSWCQNICTSNNDDAKALNELMSKLSQNSIQSDWCQNVFLPAVNNEKAELHNLLNDVKQVEAEISGDAKIIVQQVRGQISEWSNPSSFPKLFDDYNRFVVDFQDALNISSSDAPLALSLKLNILTEMVDALDLSIKELGTSRLYSDKTEQARNFQKMLHPLNNLMCSLSDVAFHGEKFNGTKASYLDDIRNKLTKYDITDQDLLPTASFSVNNVTIDRGNTVIGYSDEMRHCKTLADVHTLLHQNLLTEIGLIGRAKKVAMPKEVEAQIQTVINSIETVKASNKTYNVSVLLLSTVQKDNKLVSYYNIPLRNHNAMMSIEYDLDSKKTILHLKIFNMHHDNVRILERDTVDLLTSNINVVTPPTLEYLGAPPKDLMLQRDNDITTASYNYDIELNHNTVGISAGIVAETLSSTFATEGGSSMRHGMLNPTDFLRDETISKDKKIALVRRFEEHISMYNPLLSGSVAEVYYSQQEGYDKYKFYKEHPVLLSRLQYDKMNQFIVDIKSEHENALDDFINKNMLYMMAVGPTFIQCAIDNGIKYETLVNIESEHRYTIQQLKKKIPLDFMYRLITTNDVELHNIVSDYCNDEERYKNILSALKKDDGIFVNSLIAYPLLIKSPFFNKEENFVPYEICYEKFKNEKKLFSFYSKYLHHAFANTEISVEDMYYAAKDEGVLDKFFELLPYKAVINSGIWNELSDKEKESAVSIFCENSETFASMCKLIQKSLDNKLDDEKQNTVNNIRQYLSIDKLIAFTNLHKNRKAADLVFQHFPEYINDLRVLPTTVPKAETLEVEHYFLKNAISQAIKNGADRRDQDRLIQAGYKLYLYEGDEEKYAMSMLRIMDEHTKAPYSYPSLRFLYGDVEQVGPFLKRLQNKNSDLFVELMSRNLGFFIKYCDKESFLHVLSTTKRYDLLFNKNNNVGDVINSLWEHMNAPQRKSFIIAMQSNNMFAVCVVESLLNLDRSIKTDIKDEIKTYFSDDKMIEILGGGPSLGFILQAKNVDSLIRKIDWSLHRDLVYQTRSSNIENIISIYDIESRKNKCDFTLKFMLEREVSGCSNASVKASCSENFSNCNECFHFVSQVDGDSSNLVKTYMYAQLRMNSKIEFKLDGNIRDQVKSWNAVVPLLDDKKFGDDIMNIILAKSSRETLTKIAKIEATKGKDANQFLLNKVQAKLEQMPAVVEGRNVAK